MNSAENNLQKELKKVSAKDREYIQSGLDMLGPDPSSLGHMKNIFFGNLNQSLVFPYPDQDDDEKKRCDELIERLDHYLSTDHPTIQIDQKQEIPPEVVQRLFEIGVLGMTIPAEHGGLGLGITSYNKVLSRIGRTCGSTAVMVSAHQSIGCKALMLFGTDEQKKRFLPRMAKDALSAFCLSEPNVGCDAGGQETCCELSEDGTHYIINGEKKWATSGALAGFFTVMARQEIVDPKSGKKKNKITALICTPDMEGIEIFSRNRSKCGIRGTWQARIRLTNVRVPVENRLHDEGRGLNVALSCLNYGRCTLSAGMVGAGSYAYEQALKWAKYRYQFKQPLESFDQVREKLARMGAYVYAMESMLYMTTGFLDRGDEDIMVETAICKVTCSELGWQVLDDCVQIMGGESYMTENEIERIWRDSRINRIVEGANEVMHQFICNYGGKNLLESLLAIKNEPFKHILPGIQVASEIFLGIKRSAPRIDAVDPSLSPLAQRLSILIRDFSHEFKRMAAELKEGFATNHLAHERISKSVICIHGLVCALSRLDMETRKGIDRDDLARNKTLVEHLFDLHEHEITRFRREMRDNTDASMRPAADAAIGWGASLPDSDYAIPERTPVESARGNGKTADQSHIEQFGAGTTFSGTKC